MTAQLVMVALGAVCAILLSLAVLAVGWMLPRPRRFGFDVRDED